MFRFLFLGLLLIFISGCQSMPPATSNNAINPQLCTKPEYLTEVQKRLCMQQKSNASPSYKPVEVAERKPPHKLTAAEIAIVKRGVSNSLKDPTSPLFGSMKASKSKTGLITVCGFVNAKNSFGAYTGRQPFIGALADNKFVLIGMGGTAIHTTATYNICAQESIPLL